MHALRAARRVAPRVFPKFGGQKLTYADDGPRLTPHVDMISECGPTHSQQLKCNRGARRSAEGACAARVSDRFDLGIHDRD